MMGDRAVIDGRIYTPMACITLTNVQDPKICNDVFQCRRGEEKMWFEVESDKKPQRIDQPNQETIFLFLLDYYE